MTNVIAGKSGERGPPRPENRQVRSFFERRVDFLRMGFVRAAEPGVHQTSHHLG